MTADALPSSHSDAVAWHIRLKDSRVEDWEAFVDWLAVDPAHSRDYDDVAIEDSKLDPVVKTWAQAVPAMANDNTPEPRRTGERTPWFGRIGGAAAAAAAVAVLAVTGSYNWSAHDRFDVVTGPGEKRAIELAGGSEAFMNGGTRLTIDRKDPRFASLQTGEAAFTIVHDPDHPFVLALGDDRVEDVGTTFNAIRGQDGPIIEVAEGSVLYDPNGAKILLGAGQTLSSSIRDGQIVLDRKQASEIGTWRQGRLSYQSRPLATVAADLARNLGVEISVQPSVAAQPFSGTIRIDRDQKRMFARLELLLDVHARKTEDGWSLGPRQK